MYIKLYALLLLNFLFAIPVFAWGQRHDGGQDLTEQSFTYGGALDVLYTIATKGDSSRSKNANEVHIRAKDGKFRLSLKVDGVRYDTIVTQNRTLSLQGSVKYNFDRPHPQSLVGTPPVPVNLEGVTLLRVRPESYYILQPGSTFGVATINTSGRDTSHTAIDRSFFPAEVALSIQEGQPVVSEIRIGDKSRPLRTFHYSEHKKLGNLWMPGRIECQYFTTSPPVTTIYTLKSMRPTADSDQFDIDAALKKGDLVQSDTGSSVASFQYDPGKSLTEQHSVAAARQKEIDDELAREQQQRRYNSSIMLVMVGAGLFLFWYARRRMNRTSSVP